MDREAKAVKKDLEGYDVELFSKLGDMEIGHPFFRLVEINSRRDMKIVMIGCPMFDFDIKKFWYLLSIGYMPLGIMSYRHWPEVVEEELRTDTRIMEMKEHQYDLIKLYAGWLHCHKDPDSVRGLANLPRLNFAESDLQWSMTKAFYKYNEKVKLSIEWDLVYVNLDYSEWHNSTKGYPLAFECFTRLVDELNLKILIIGRNASGTYLDGKIHSTNRMLPFSEILETFAKSKALFLPQMSDASPRIIT